MCKALKIRCIEIPLIVNIRGVWLINKSSFANSYRIREHALIIQTLKTLFYVLRSEILLVYGQLIKSPHNILTRLKVSLIALPKGIN